MRREGRAVGRGRAGRRPERRNGAQARLAAGDYWRSQTCWFNWRRDTPCSVAPEWYASWTAPALDHDNAKLSAMTDGWQRMSAMLCEAHARQFAEQFGIKIPEGKGDPA